MEENFEDRPFGSAEESELPWKEDESVPGSDSEGTDHKVLVRAQVRREVEGRGERWGGSHDGGQDQAGRVTGLLM
jgi:hypothetical protein